jgi:bifunctional N-acetylglucosamine-1-phosphate-uridyltransferase/glucosamine-1-phosphate-acetyltransferase GlmU-like protein
MQTEDLLRDFVGDILILSGDVPMLRYETIKNLINEHTEKGNTVTLLTAVFENPGGYGRIIRSVDGQFLRIVEDKDASEEEKKIKEINPAIYILDSKVLFDALKKITPDNIQNEYYLTDIFNFIPADRVGTVIAPDENEVKGINSLDQLRELESLLKS